MTSFRPIKAILFDLDGTLLDTLDDLAHAVNRVLARAGLPVHDRAAYRRFVGDGSRMLITRALPSEHRQPDRIETFLAAFKADYGRHWAEATRPYPGIPDLLAALSRRGIACGVVTNKPQSFAERCVQHFFDKTPFGIVHGQRETVPLKPHPQAARMAAAHLQVPVSNCLFLGDSGVDMETARSAGMLPVGAAWGFRPREELIRSGAHIVLEHPGEVLGWVDGERTA